MALTWFPTSGDAAHGGASGEDKWELMATSWISSGVIPGIGNEFAVYADSTGMRVKVPSGRAWLDGTMANEDAAGADIIQAIAAADPANPRIDRIVLRRDFTNHTMAYVVVAGTPAVAPVPPSITRVAQGIYDLSLAQVRVNAGAVTIAAGNVTDERSAPSVCGWATPPNGPPTGSLMAYAGATAPRGWLLADGSAISRTSYAALFAAIGATFGAGDGSTTFNLPDLRGRVPVGAGTGTGLTTRALGATGGEESHVLSTAELAAHTHGVNDPAHAHGATTTINDPGHNHSQNSHGHNVTDPTHAHQVGPGNLFLGQFAAGGVGINGFSGSGIPPSTTGVATGVSVNGVTATNVAATSAVTASPTVNAAATGISTANAGSGTAHNTMPPFAIVNHIIKV